MNGNWWKLPSKTQIETSMQVAVDSKTKKQKAEEDWNKLLSIFLRGNFNLKDGRVAKERAQREVHPGRGTPALGQEASLNPINTLNDRPRREKNVILPYY